ncbi:MAG: arylesterase [Gemmatimonadota bacterium]
MNDGDTAGARSRGRWKQPLRFPALLPDRIIVGSARALLLLVIIGAMTGCGRERPSTVAAKPRADSAPAAAVQPVPDSTSGARPTIVFLGTSLTAGLGLDPDDAYPAMIQRKIDSAGLAFRVVNAGESGESSAGALRRVDWVLRGKPVMLVVETGANDGLRGQDPDSLRGNIESLLGRARADAPDAQLILAGMEALPNLGAVYARRFHAIYPAIAEKYKLPLIPFLLANVAGMDSLNQADGIHPNIKGERIVADNVWRVLGPLLKARH